MKLTLLSTLALSALLLSACSKEKGHNTQDFRTKDRESAYNTHHPSSPKKLKSESSGDMMYGLGAPAEEVDGLIYDEPVNGLPADYNTEGYDHIVENNYKLAIEAPKSTFSIDVDVASYANVRRFLSYGQKPPAGAVRIEEMINYFNYDYPEPKNEHPFSVNTEVSDCPWNKEHRLVHIGLKAKDIPAKELPASNLVFLLDVSGSMSDPNKLPLLKQAFGLLVGELDKDDRVSIVVYAGAAGRVLEPTPGDQKEKILAALGKLNAGGSTAGGAGIQLAYASAMENLIPQGNNRVILATDGDFNVGTSSESELVKLIETEREKGIFLTVLGFGMGNYQDAKMEKLADNGNGNYAYIDTYREARKVLVQELNGTLHTIAKDVKLQLDFNPAKVKAYRLIGYENRVLQNEDFNNDKKDAGDMGAGHTVTALYEIIPADSKEEVPSASDSKYIKTEIDPKAFTSGELLTISLRYKQPTASVSTLMTHPVLDLHVPMAKTSNNFRFSAAVAGFGLILRDSKFKGDASYDIVRELAKGSLGEDKMGYRAEFLRLIGDASVL